jgi:hypothetical protein
MFGTISVYWVPVAGAVSGVLTFAAEVFGFVF